MAVARDTGLILGQAVSQDRNLETFQALADTLPAAQRYASDGLVGHTELVWPQEGQHVLSRRKEESYTVESLKPNLRTSLAHWPAPVAVSVVRWMRGAVRLFVYYNNHRQHLYLAHPAYRGRLPLLFLTPL